VPVINPATELPGTDFADHPSAEIDHRLQLAHDAGQTWCDTAIGDRCGKLKNLAAQLRRQKTALAATMTAEMGKPIVAAEGEVEKCAAACDYVAEHAPRMLASQPINSDARRSYVRFDPLGVILAIMPWNFPLWQLFRFGAAAVAAGNVIALKHAPNVPGCAQAIEELFAAAGFPRGVLVNLRLADNARAQALVSDARIAAITLTGSERAGAAVAGQAAGVLKKTVLELGGSDAFIVLADVNIPAVAHAAAAARCINSGQSCIAAKRFIVLERVAEQFATALAQAMAEMIVGDPTDRATQLGPLARIDLLHNLDRQVKASLAAGAKLLTGGYRLEHKGFFYAPTVLTNVRPGMEVFDEETFGPVAAVIRAVDIADAIRLANASRYGLGASIWTGNAALAEPIAAELEVGNVFINGPVKSDPRLPCGGTKRSGWGKELGEIGLREFCNVKTVWVGER